MKNSQIPVAPKHPHVITQHNQTRIDNYFWMRYREDPEVTQYLKSENDYLEEITQHTTQLQEKLFHEMKSCLKENDSSAPEQQGNFLYYTKTEAGKQYPLYCRVPDSSDRAEQILIDLNRLSEGKAFIRLGAFSVSPDGSKLAYSIDVDGSEKCQLFIKDLTNDTLFPEIIANTSGSVIDHSGVEWASDSQTFFLWRSQEGLTARQKDPLR